MKIIKNATKFHIEEQTAVAIGKFDGFHLGHQKLLRHLEMKKSKGLKTVAFTFVPSPAAFFGMPSLQELSTVEEKRNVFENAGVDYLVEYPFIKETAGMAPEAFVQDVLAGMINAKCVVAGDDVSFGKGGKGDCALLAEMARKGGCDYEVEIIEKVLYNGTEISSTFARNAVQEGSMELAAALLGEPYHVGGEIVHGRKLGRILGMPTVNLMPPEEKLLPPNGVYYSYVRINGRDFPAITNIGTKPTVDSNAKKGVETYIYDFDEDVYGKHIDVYLLKHKRTEMRFAGVDELKAQMAADIEDGRGYHEASVKRKSACRKNPV